MNTRKDYRVLIALNGLCIYDIYFEMYIMSKRNPRIFYFFCMKCLSLVYIRDESGNNDMKVIGDVATFTFKCKCDISDFYY